MMEMKIKNLYCETIVGVYEEEKKRRQPLVFNIKIKYDAGASHQSDNVADTLNYHPIVEGIKKHIEATNYDLVEKAIEDAGRIIMAHEKVHSCKVEAAKTKGPVEYIESFSVTKSFKRK